MANEIPEELGNRYRIDRLIAEGGMARVYQGIDTLLGRKVALKVLSANLAMDPAFVARFEREAQSVASLSHPNLVGVFDIGADGEFHYIVMEYVEGSTLDVAIRREAPMAADRVTGITLSVCEGLGVAHSRGIVHRDIKPANIMIEPNGRVKVMDFGIAKTKIEGLTQVGAVLGTVRYLAPEQAYAAPVDRRADIYALGCVMYEMLTGRPPISGDSLIEIANKLMTEQPPPPSALVPEVPAGLERVVMKALAKNPDNRYSDTDSMRLDLGGLAPAGAAAAGADATAVSGSSSTVVQTRPERTQVMPGGPAGEPPRRLGLLVLGVLLLAGGAIALVSDRLGSDSPTQTPSPLPLESPSPAFSPAPPRLPAPAPSPTPPSEGGANTARDQALQTSEARIESILRGGVQSGEVSDRAEDQILAEVGKVVSENEKGDVDDALDAVEEAREEVAKYVERDEVSPSIAAGVNGQLDEMAQALAS